MSVASDPLSVAVLQEMFQQNQATVMAMQGGTAGADLLRQQVVMLNKQLEDLRERHQ